MILNPRTQFRPDTQGRIKLNWEGFAFLKHEAVRGAYFSDEPLDILLDGCDILGHDGLLWVLSIIRSRTMRGLGSTYVTLPREERQLTFLNGLKFPAHVLNAGGGISNEYVLLRTRLSGEARSFVESDSRVDSPYSPWYIQLVTSGSWRSVFQALDRYTKRTVAELTNLSPSGEEAVRSEAFRKAMGELIINVALHGGTPQGSGVGYVCYRPWAKTHPVLRFCCNDIGPGFRETFSRRQEFNFKTEEEAALYALIYRHKHPREGVLGLYNALPYLYALRGCAWIRSADSLVRLDLSDERIRAIFAEGYSDAAEEWVRRMVKCWHLEKLPGCHIAVDLQWTGTSREKR